MDVATLSTLLQDAEEHHGQYEPTAPPHHWWNWYAPFIIARQQGRTPDQAVADATKHSESIGQ